MLGLTNEQGAQHTGIRAGHGRSRSGRCYVAFLLLLLATLYSCGRMLGQAQNSGQIAGNVADTEKAVVPGAAITLKSEERGTVLTGKSDAKGEYVLNDVPAGTYTLTVVAPNFQTYIVNHVTVDADSHLRLDAELKVGEVTSQVEVTAGTKAVDTQSATISAIIDNDLVENLPIDGNNVVALAALLPGVTDVNAPTTFTNDTGGPSFAVNGSRSTSNLFLFDGLSWNNLFQNTALNYPNHAALQTVAVQLNNFTAQYGRNAGSIVNVLSKSGTNAIHGETFLFYQTGKVDATDYFTKVQPKVSQYQFGGAVGGPIIRDKLFYEAEMQVLIASGTATANADTLSYAERGLQPDGVTPRPCDTTSTASFAGFSQCASFAGDVAAGAAVGKVLLNPLWTGTNALNPTIALSEFNSTWLAGGHTGTNPCITALQNAPVVTANPTANTRVGYFQDPELPSVCFDPTFTNILNHFNAPNPTLNNNGTFLVGVSVVPQPRHEYGGNLRVDWNASSRHIVDFHYYQTHNNDASTNGVSATTGVETYEPDFNVAVINAGSVGDTWVLGPALLNVMRVGYKRYVYGVDPLDKTTLQGLGSDYTSPTAAQLPIINVSTRFQLGSTAGIFTNNVNEDIEGLDTLSYTHGSHNIETGVDYVRAQYQSITSNPGVFTFNNQYANNVGAEAILGLLYNTQVSNNQNISAVQHALFSYFQDTWRALPRLTLTLGVRYELPWNWYQPKGYAETFIRNYQSVKYPNAPANLAFVGDPGVSRALYPTKYNNISPRIGIAYDLFGNGKTAIRAGFGSFYDATPAQVVGIGEPYHYAANYALPPGSLSYPLYQLPAIQGSFEPGQPATFTSPQTIVFPDANFQNSYTWGFNLGVQQQVNRTATFEMNYIGRLSRHLTQPFDLNPAIRDCSGSYYQANPSLYCWGGPVATNNPASPETPAQTAAISCTESGTVKLYSTAAPYCPTFNASYGARVVYPQFNYGGQGIIDYSATGTASYHAFQVIYVQRAKQFLTMIASYTFSKSIDEQSNISTTNAIPSPIVGGNTLNYQYGPSDLNTKQVFNMGFRLTLPRTATAKPWVRQIVNDWDFDGIYNARDGHPFNPVISGDDSSFDEPQQRVFLTPGQSPFLPNTRHRTQKIAEWFNVAAMSKPNNGTLGNVGRNFVLSPASITTTFSLTKTVQLTKLREGMRAQFRVEVFGPFNTVNLGTPGTGLSTSTAATSTFGVIQNDNGGNRKMQFGYLMYF